MALLAADAHATDVLRHKARLIAQARKAWRGIDPAFIGESWAPLTRALAATVSEAQLALASSGVSLAADTLAEQGRWVASQVFIDPRAFAGVAPDGRDLAGLLQSPAYTAKRLIGQGMEPLPALRSARHNLDRIMASIATDTARQATAADLATRPGVGYVRHLVGTSCPNCVILAGRFYRWNEGFDRHPGDDCVHIPATEALAGTVLTDPYQHFWSMSEAEQDEFWGPGDAQAIRDGADIYRVGNARRGAKGMTTLEGTSSRRKRVSSGPGFAQELRGHRLTPDGIYADNPSREVALRRLEEHGYLLRDPYGRVVQAPGGYIRGAFYEGFGQMGRGGTRRGASFAVEHARATGVRDPRDPATMTAAERRFFDAETRYTAVVDGRNPFGRTPLTPQIAARVEKEYRRALLARVNATIRS